ncbi:hypothetical protein L207DRAFT_225990 [Hyaloscypha variabilis F]|uniref:Uncharacterized protein n=1 Tax=Hyaloscypha variabilis (strain UAMH 11265 / GT02V1 / F) TaxID=1149755 RepID=A0A2J6QVS8_HYAVF|nr:hypothetical protein L207DRAFT_225990 [Hyaloscypha variabilis F]
MAHSQLAHRETLPIDQPAFFLQYSQSRSANCSNLYRQITNIRLLGAFGFNDSNWKVKMSELNQLILHDPKYGSVRQICRALGYSFEGGNSERRKPPRSVSLLRSITGKFRKQFVGHYFGLDHFPLDYQSPEVQQCVSQFLTEHARLFEDSDQARQLGWPIYPRDSENSRLTDGLAKLMCTQEYHHRRHLQARQKMAREESGDSSLDDSLLDESDSEQSEIFYRSSRHPITVGTTQEERDAINFEKVRDNIELHLEFIYPLDGSAEERSSAWLFNVSCLDYSKLKCYTDFIVGGQLAQRLQAIRMAILPRIQLVHQQKEQLGLSAPVHGRPEAPSRY